MEPTSPVMNWHILGSEILAMLEKDVVNERTFSYDNMQSWKAEFNIAIFSHLLHEPRKTRFWGVITHFEGWG